MKLPQFNIKMQYKYLNKFLLVYNLLKEIFLNTYQKNFRIRFKLLNT